MSKWFLKSNVALTVAVFVILILFVLSCTAMIPAIKMEKWDVVKEILIKWEGPMTVVMGFLFTRSMSNSKEQEKVEG